MEWALRAQKDLESDLRTSFEQGLRADEVATRRATYGPNALPEAPGRSYLAIFGEQFLSPLIYVLIAAAFTVLIVGNTADALIIAVVLVFNAIIGTIQEGRAQNALRALRRLTETTATVVREGALAIIRDTEIVPGDIVVMAEGEKIPADIRLVETNSLRVDQSILTGESGPVFKSTEIPHERPRTIADATTMLFKGTTIVGGNGRGVVVATGRDTEVGKISESLAGIDTEIPLKRDIRALSKLIIKAIVVISIVLFSIGVWRGNAIREMLATVVALAVSIIPEGLPVVLTVILATGVSRMARRNALVKRLQAVEALGQAKVIAVDKTGTLTRNELVVRRVVTGDRSYHITGTGYEPTGEVQSDGRVVDPLNHPDLLFAGKIATFSASAHATLRTDTNSWQVSGDPTEAALRVFGKKIGFRKSDLEQESPQTAEIPFDYRTRYHVVVNRIPEGQLVSITGAPEAIRELVTTHGTHPGTHHALASHEWKKIEARIDNASHDGLRVIAFAFKIISHDTPGSDIDIRHATFGGFYALEDALRPEVPDALMRAQDAGLRVVMITGDHPFTAAAVAKNAGIWHDGDRLITGEELNTLPPKELAAALDRTSVFSRITPTDKMKIIEAYRARGEIIAMTGDGVNDAPSLVAADLGVAMGKIGTEVAKEASDIILLDDNFGSIVSAIEEGRNMYRTIQKTLLYLFSTNLGELLAIIGALVVGLPLPILPAQILWMNLVTDPFMGTALAFEPHDKNLLRGGDNHRSSLFSSSMALRALFLATVMMVGTLFVFTRYQDDLPRAWTMTLTTLAIFQWFNAFNCRSERKSIVGHRFIANPYLLGALVVVFLLQVAVVYLPVFQTILRTVPLTIGEWGLAAGVALSIILAEELRKAGMRLFGPGIKTA